MKKLMLLTALLFSAIFYGGVVEAGTLVLMETTKGDIVIELFDEQAPVTVNNFLGYVEDGYYNGTIFHRVIDGFMIQGGGFDKDFNYKTTRKPIKNEASKELQNLPYTIAMARTNDPHSATSQFFINVANNKSLNFKNTTTQGYGYAVFGRVVKGTEVVDEISYVRTGKYLGHSDVPNDVIEIKNVKVLHGGGNDSNNKLD